MMNRNGKLFEEYFYTINALIGRNYGRIKRCNIETDDLKQELSIALLGFIDAYDPNRGTSMRNYLFSKLQNEIYKKTRYAEQHGITGLCKGDVIDFVYLDQPYGGLDYMEMRNAA